jgi:hypothetical protein
LIYSRFVSRFFPSEDHSLVFVGEDKQKPDLQLNGAENSMKKSKSFISLKHSRWSRSSGKLPDPLSSGAESSQKPINLEDTEWNNAIRCLFVFCYVFSEYSCVCVIDREGFNNSGSVIFVSFWYFRYENAFIEYEYVCRDDKYTLIFK